MSHSVSPTPSAASGRRPVAVIGGGIAGLTAAWSLQQRGIAARVFEASRHLGGRIQSVDEGGVVETGMQFYYSNYRETFKLLKTFGLKEQLTPISVDGLIYWDGRVGTFSKSRPWLKVLSAGENFQLQRRIARRVVSLLRLSPFEAREADALDGIDVVDYFNRCTEGVVEAAVRPMVNSYAFCEPEGHSLAMMLKVIKLGAAAKAYGLSSGNDALPRAMAARLDCVHGRVTRVIVEADRVQAIEVESDAGTERVAVSGVVAAARAHETAALIGHAAPELAQQLGQVAYSTIVLATLHLDRRLEGNDWVYVMSRKAGHRAAFAIDLARRMPSMFPSGNSVIQVDFAMPVSDEVIDWDDEAIVAQALRDLEAFLPQIGGWVVGHSIVRRRRALPNFPTGSFRRVAEIQRLAAPIQSFALAGDFLRSPLCESAVRSGLDAARIVAAD